MKELKARLMPRRHRGCGDEYGRCKKSRALQTAFLDAFFNA
jgi:hypothetical protein